MRLKKENLVPGLGWLTLPLSKAARKRIETECEAFFEAHPDPGATAMKRRDGDADGRMYLRAMEDIDALLDESSYYQSILAFIGFRARSALRADPEKMRAEAHKKQKRRRRAEGIVEKRAARAIRRDAKRQRSMSPKMTTAAKDPCWLDQAKALTSPQRTELLRLAEHDGPAHMLGSGRDRMRCRVSLRTLGLVSFYNEDGSTPGALTLAAGGWGGAYDRCALTARGVIVAGHLTWGGNGKGERIAVVRRAPDAKKGSA